MVRGFAVSAVFVLLLSSAAVAAIGQAQGYLMDNQNNVATTGGGSALNTNGLNVSQSQLATDQSSRTTSYQGEVGSLNQSAGAFPVSGVLGANQSGVASGVQAQVHPGGISIGAQDQDVDALLVQDLFGEGVGMALALQNFVGIQTQVTFSLFGASANFQSVGVVQYDALGGPNPVNNVISGGADIGAGQSVAP